MDQNSKQQQVRIDISGSGQSPEAIHALTGIIARALQNELPDQQIQVAGQNQNLRGSLESFDNTELSGLQFGQVTIVADQNKQFEDPSMNKDLQSFTAPRFQNQQTQGQRVGSQDVSQTGGRSTGH